MGRFPVLSIAALILFPVFLSAEQPDIVVSTNMPAADKRTNFEKLSDTEPITRRNAVISLGSEKKKTNIPALIKMLADSNIEVKRTAINALALSGDPRAISPLMDILKTEKNIQAKMSALVALGDLKSREAVPLISSFLKDPYPIFRTEAIRTLGKINSSESYNEIAVMLSDEAEGVRIMAAQTAGNLKISSAVPLLVRNLNDRVNLVRRACAQALGKTGRNSEIPELEKLLSDKDPSVAAAAKEAINAINER